MYLARYARQLQARHTIGSAVSFFLPDCIVAWLDRTRFLFPRFLRPHLARFSCWHSPTVLYPIQFCPADLAIHMPRIICVCDCCFMALPPPCPALALCVHLSCVIEYCSTNTQCSLVHAPIHAKWATNGALSFWCLHCQCVSNIRQATMGSDHPTSVISNGNISRKSILGSMGQGYMDVVLGKGNLLHVVACLYLLSVSL